jgi:hypothetical protein
VAAIEDLDRCYELEPYPVDLERYIGEVDRHACAIEVMLGIVEECPEVDNLPQP